MKDDLKQRIYNIVYSTLAEVYVSSAIASVKADGIARKIIKEVGSSEDDSKGRTLY